MFKSSINQHRTALGEFQISSTRKGDRCTNCTLSEHTKQGTKGSLWGGIFPWSLRNDLGILGRQIVSATPTCFSRLPCLKNCPLRFPNRKSVDLTLLSRKSLDIPLVHGGGFTIFHPHTVLQVQKSCTSWYMVNIPLFFLKGFNLPRWCRVSSIHSSNPFWEHLRPTSTASKRWWPATA